MARGEWTPEQRAEALALYVELGPSEAGRRTGIPKGTIGRWAADDGLDGTFRAEQTQAANERHRMSIAQRKQALAEGLINDAERLRAQLFDQCERKEVHSVSDGANSGAHIEITTVEMAEPTFGDKKAIMTAIAIAVDKVLLLTGEATSRTEVVGRTDSDPLDRLRDDLKARRQAA